MNPQPKIFIFDKKTDDRFLLVHFLRYFSFNVEVINDIEDFSHQITRYQPDLLILSDTLSPSDGCQICEVLAKRAENDTVYIVMLVEETLARHKNKIHGVAVDMVVSRPRITDKDYSYFKIAEFVHQHLINKYSGNKN